MPLILPLKGQGLRSSKDIYILYGGHDRGGDSLHVRLLVANRADERGQTDGQKDIQTDRKTDRQRDI